MKTFATRQALCLSTGPSALCLMRKTHLLPKKFSSGGRETVVQIQAFSKSPFRNPSPPSSSASRGEIALHGASSGRLRLPVLQLLSLD